MSRHLIAYGENGRGVFTTVDLKEGDLVEVCPTLVLNIKDLSGRIGRYLFSHPDNIELAVLPLGYGALYNHSDDKWNVHYEVRETEMVYVAAFDIPAMSELLIFYGETYDWSYYCAGCGERHNDHEDLLIARQVKEHNEGLSDAEGARQEGERTDGASGEDPAALPDV